MTSCARCEWAANPIDPTPATEQVIAHADMARHPLCRCCAKSLPEQDKAVCIPCVADARRTLQQVVELYALLPDTFGSIGSSSDWRRNGPRGQERPMPGGDALVMHGPGGASGEGDPSDPPAIGFELAAWADDWRACRYEPTRNVAAPATMSAFYLNARIGWAADHHEAFPSFLTDLHRILTRLETTLATGERPDRGAACQGCGVDLQRHYADPKPCGHLRPRFSLKWIKGHDGMIPESILARDARVAAWDTKHAHCNQGGLEESWKCPKCQRVYTQQEYVLACAQERFLKEGSAHYWVPVATAARLVGRAHMTIKGWVDAVEVVSVCDVRTKRLKVLLSSVYDLAKERKKPGSKKVAS